MQLELSFVKDCKRCVYTCACCESRFHHSACSGCDKFDSFKPAANIKFCPLDGVAIKTILDKREV